MEDLKDYKTLTRGLVAPQTDDDSSTDEKDAHQTSQNSSHDGANV